MKLCLVIFLISFAVFSSAQTGSEIFLFDLKIEKGQVILSNGVNITNHKGYDNQPFFHPSKPLIYYSSFDDSARSDIKFYNYKTKQTSNFTVTREREYSPTVTPDEKFISCIIQRDNGSQDLAKFPVDGGKPKVMINHLKIGYHSWAANNKLLLFVLDDSTHNSLHYYYSDTDADTVIAENIGRSLHKIPGQNAMSFVQKVEGKPSVLKKFDMNTGIISTIITLLPGQDHLTWTNKTAGNDNAIILMSDGSKLFFHKQTSFEEVKDRGWQPVILKQVATMFKGISRIAVNANNTKLALVVSE